jgi:hypothetical protein
VLASYSEEQVDTLLESAHSAKRARSPEPGQAANEFGETTPRWLPPGGRTWRWACTTARGLAAIGPLGLAPAMQLLVRVGAPISARGVVSK